MEGSELSIGDFDRKGVLILGETSKEIIAPFTERNLSIKPLAFSKASEAIDAFNTIKAIIYSAPPGQYFLIKRNFDELFEVANNYGIEQKILVHNEKDMQQFEKIFGSDQIIRHFQYRAKIKELAEQIARYSPGPPCALGLVIKGKISKLDEEKKLVLRRAFHDCKKIHVEPITGGRDASCLLKVYAWLENSEFKASMLPFFVKISSPEKIDKELDNYRVITDLFISFQYRPNCRLERCVRSQNYKSLVGNFVEDSITLRMALENTYHTGILHSLFEKSLRGFRRHPITLKAGPIRGPLRDFVKEKIWIEDLKERADLIDKAKDFGLKSDISQLHDRLLAICTEFSKMAPIHGDLHSGNVMVSGHDAILIDFSAAKLAGPLTADPATLEISLCFNPGEIIPSFNKWKRFINEAYHPQKILKPLAHTDQVPNEFSWLRRAVREIRHILIGCDCCKSEIEIIIACYLMRIARLTPKTSTTKREKTEFKYHAYALVMAERIIDSLTNPGK